MLADMETKDPLQNLRDRLLHDSDVEGIYVLEEYGVRHVWVLLCRWTTDARYQVYDAEEAADPSYSLHLHLTDNVAEIHPAASPVR